MTLSLFHPTHLLPFPAKSTPRIFSGQFSSCSKEIAVSPCPPLFTYLFNLFFFLHLLVNEGKLPLTGTLPSCGNGFPGPLLCQLLAAVVLQSKRCRNPFSGQCLWLRMLLPLYVCVCVLLRGRDRVWMRENELDLNACDECLSCLFITASMLCLFLFNLNFKLLCPEKILISTTAGTVPKLFYCKWTIYLKTIDPIDKDTFF